MPGSISLAVAWIAASATAVGAAPWTTPDGVGSPVETADGAATADEATTADRIAPPTDDAASPSRPAPTTPGDAPAPDTEPPSDGFFDGAKTGEGEPPPGSPEPAPPMPTVEELPSNEGGAPPMPTVEELPSRDGGAPPMPPVEELPSRDTGDDPPSKRGRLFDRNPPSADRAPAGAEGGSFFDPGKLDDTGPSGGAIQIRGYVAANFFVAMRTNTLVREDDDSFQRLKPQPFFDVTSATLYVGAPIFADIVYARMGLEFLSIPQQQIVPSRPDVVAQPNRQLYFESAAIEVNPFTWAKRSGRWFREGFKVTAGVFIMPFGLEDESHANPANWFIGRPRAMTSGRVYPGTWTDVGATVKWKPTFGEQKPIRPIEIDVGLVNGDPCTQTRFLDALFQPDQGPLRCARVRRQGEVAQAGVFDDAEGPLPINSGFFGVAPDNNNNKSLFARVQGYPLPAINVGGSFVWGKHPEAVLPTGGETTVELEQGASWRAGGHLDVNFEDIFNSDYPLPHLRGEVVYGVDRAVDIEATADRRMLGGYAQIAQALFRRKKTRLPGLILQYRFDHADPSLDTPGTVNGVPIVSDFSDTVHAGESTQQSHTIGLRFPVLPRFAMKAEYSIIREDGGPRNQLNNDLFGLELVADF